MNFDESTASRSAVGRVPVDLSCRNVGGIAETEVTISPGVTVLSGRNATNRTSLLQAIMAALGSDRVSLKADADEGEVELDVGDETYTRSLQRTDAGVSLGGDPFLDDTEKADLFAFLLESNEARRAVERGADLREIIMRPVDTTEIHAEIERLEANKRQVDATLDELDDLADELPALEEKRTRLESKLEAKQEALEETERAIEEADASLDRSRERIDEIEDRLDDLRSVRSSLEDIRFQLNTQRESLEALETDREDIADELASIEDVETIGEDLNAEIDRLRDRRSELEAEISELQSLVSFNQNQLEGSDGGHLSEAFGESNDEESVTDRLVDGDSLTCWTCGTAVDQSAIEETVDRLRRLLNRKRESRSELEARLDELTERRKNRQQRESERRQLESRLEEVDDEIAERKELIRDLEARREELEAESADLEAAVEDAPTDTEYEELVELHAEANRIEIDMERIESELASVEGEIDEIEDQLGERERLADRRAEIDDRLAELRNRIERLETEAVESFNEHMETVLELLEYSNLERIWIERRVTNESVEGIDRQSEFDLHVVRTSDSGSAYEDTIDHLSESEREVTGLVFALAGYLVHEVYKDCPFVLLDSLEAIDANRIADIVEYIAEYPDYLVVALLPDDADALSLEHERVTDI